jgi:hypothetical protein
MQNQYNGSRIYPSVMSQHRCTPRLPFTYAPSAGATFLLWLGLCLVVVGLDICTARAEMYTLIINDQMGTQELPFCRAYLANLNAFPPETPPMVCEAMIHPAFPDFSKPAWRQWSAEELWERRKIVRQLQWYLRYWHHDYAGAPLIRQTPTDTMVEKLVDGAPDFAYIRWEPQFKANIQGRHLRMSEAFIKTSAFGTVTMVKYEIDICDPYAPYSNGGGGRKFFMLNPQGDGLDFTNVELKFSPFAHSTDLFVYRGEVNYQSWSWEGDFDYGVLFLHGSTCRYRYESSLAAAKRRKVQ